MTMGNVINRSLLYKLPLLLLFLFQLWSCRSIP